MHCPADDFRRLLRKQIVVGVSVKLFLYFPRKISNINCVFIHSLRLNVRRLLHFPVSIKRSSVELKISRFVYSLNTTSRALFSLSDFNCRYSANQISVEINSIFCCWFPNEPFFFFLMLFSESLWTVLKLFLN